MSGIFKNIGNPQQVHFATATDLLYKYLKDGATIDMSVDGSSTPVKYKYTVPTDSRALITRVMIVILDKGPIPTKFGGVATLTNGLDIQIFDSDGTTVLVDFLDGAPITQNAEFGCLAGVDIQIDAGAASDSLIVRWTLRDAGASAVLTEGQIFQMTVNDDLTGLDSMVVLVQGLEAEID